MHFKHNMLILSVLQLLSIPLLGLPSVEWRNPLVDSEECPTEVLFAPALLQSEVTAAYYSGFYIASTGEKIVSKTPFMVMQPGCVSSCNFFEICPIKKDVGLLGSDWTVLLSGYSPLVGYVFGLRDNIYHLIMNTKCLNVDQCDMSVYKHSIEFSRLTIGQASDVQILSNTYDCLRADSGVVLYGFSRGSATIFNFLATEYANKDNKRVKAVVLGGCFDSMRHVCEEHWKWMPKNELFVNNLYNYIVTHLPAFGTNRVEPIDLVTQFPHDIPLLLVASRADSVVRYACTLALYEGLKAAGHKQVYLLTLEKSWHSGHLFSNNNADRERYLHTVHAFYKRYETSYIPEYAKKGEPLLAEC